MVSPLRMGMGWKCTRSWNEGSLPAAWTPLFCDRGLAVAGLQNTNVSVNCTNAVRKLQGSKVLPLMCVLVLKG